jgi:hypothetical protein
VAIFKRRENHHTLISLNFSAPETEAAASAAIKPRARNMGAMVERRIGCLFKYVGVVSVGTKKWEWALIITDAGRKKNFRFGGEEESRCRS